VKWMESQGGAILPIFNNSVSFTRVMVPYWQKCDKTYVPSLDLLTRQLENATYNYIVYNLYNRSEIVLGKNVSVDLQAAKVTANILDNKIELEVTMPTTVQGYAVQQPYRASIPTKFGEIYKFMKAYAEEAARNRYIELFMINSIYFSKTVDEGGSMHAEVPTFGMLTECGETIDRTPEQLSRGMEDLMFYTLSHIYWWMPAPTNQSVPKVYTIESLKGKTYPQLNPLFLVDDNFGINIGSSVHLSNPRPVAKANLIFRQFVTSGWCMRPYVVSYAFQTPVILKVDDPLTGTPFNIATLIDINDMMPGNCGEIPPAQFCTYNPGNPSSPSAINCTSRVGEYSCGNCGITMRVSDEGGRGVSGVLGSFGGCSLPPSDAQGVIRANVTCDADDLYLTTIQGGIPRLLQRQWCGVTPDTLDGGAVNVYEYPQLTLHFREVNLTTCEARAASGFILANTSGYGACQQSITNANITDSSFCTDESSCTRQLEAATAEESVGFNVLQPGSHNISATMLKIVNGDRSEAGSMYGSFAVRQTDRNLYIYMPLYRNVSLASYDYGMSMTAEMLSNCSISPVMMIDKV